MKQLRTGSARPELIVDNSGAYLAEPAGVTAVGFDRPFGRDRVVYALPINGVDQATMKLLDDGAGALVADPSDVLVGIDRVWIARLLSAAPTTDTRRLR